MLTLLMGVGLMAAAGLIMYPFIPARGTEPNRNEWIDIAVALTSCAFFGGGAVLTVAGVASFW